MPYFIQKMKHISFDYHFMWDIVTIGSLHVTHMSTNNQFVDVPTKLLLKSRFAILVSMIGVSDKSTIL